MNCFNKLSGKFDVLTCRAVTRARRDLFRLAALMIVLLPAVVWGASTEKQEPEIYVPYKDLPALIAPADKAILMERSQFEALLSAAEKLPQDGPKLGQITNADYAAQIQNDNVAITGRMEVVSMTKEPVMIPLAFAQVGLNRVMFDGKPAPLGYDKQGRLILIVASRGTHSLEVEARTKAQELSSGGMQFSISIPEAAAGTMSLSTPGDMEIHSTSPLSETKYDKAADRTSVELVVGGQNKLTVVLTGNGRREEDKAILLGESAATVKLTSKDQNLDCLYTTQVLRRGVRQLQFQLPSQWTITQVTCPSLVRWSIETTANKPDLQTLTVRLRSAKVGAVSVRIQAAAARENNKWSSPQVKLVDADTERGYLMVNTDDTLGIRGENLTSVRREDISAASLVTGLDANLGGRLYFHWGPSWSVALDLEDINLKRSLKEQQRIIVSSQQVTLTGSFELTAVERELFAMTFVLRGLADQASTNSAEPWQIRDVLIDGRQTGFDYRTEKEGDQRLLKIELKQPVQPEKMINVTIVMQNIPEKWDWPSNAPSRKISVPLIESQGETISGYVSVSAQGDLDAKPENVPSGLEVVPVARMVTLGMDRQIQYAYSYKAAAKGEIALDVSRKQPRQSSDSIGFVNVRPEEFSGDWKLTYVISRATDKKLYMLADKSIGQEIRITSPTVQISSKSIITPETLPFKISSELAQQYDIWQLNLDNSVIGNIEINVRYERPVPGKKFKVPLVRPVCEGQINEHLAVQASEELALKITPVAVKEIDAIDLPSLSVQSSRIIAAYQLQAPAAPDGAKVSVSLETSVHKNYEIPTALAVSADLTTYLDAQLWQQTEANFQIANASRQFLTFRLPEGAQLWSLSVGGRQAKPQRSTEGDYQVALGRLGETVNVRIVYAYHASDMTFDNTKLGGVELPGMKINQLRWNVVPPPDYCVTSQKTNMQMLEVIRTRPAYQELYDAFGKLPFKGILLAPLSRVKYQAKLKHGIEFSGGTSNVANAYVAGDSPTAGGAYYRSAERGAAEVPEPVTQKPAATQQPGQARGRGAGQRGAIPPPMAVGSTPEAVQVQQDRARDEAYLRQQIALEKESDSQASSISIQGDESRIPYEDQVTYSKDWREQLDRKTRMSDFQAGTIIAEGRYTLPVNLFAIPGAGRLVRFVGLGTGELVVGMTKQSGQRNNWIFGFLLMILVGISMLVKKIRISIAFLVVILFAMSFVAVWWPSIASFANGVFWGTIFLVPLMLVVHLVRRLLRHTGWIAGNSAVTAVLFFALCAIFTMPALAAQVAQPDQAFQINPPATVAKTSSDRLIVPYDTTPEKAGSSNKVLVPYSRFVELWNRAHPEQPIDLPRPGTDIALADVKYNVTVTKEQLGLTLTTEVKTFGKDWVTLALPVSGLAFTEAVYSGKTAQLQASPAGMVLMLPGDSSGTLQIKAVTKPQYLGQMGSIKFTLPPLPAAVMEVTLPQDDLELEIDGIESPVYKKENSSRNIWVAALGMSREMTMRWLPKVGNRTGDSTLSADSIHDVYAYHWSIIGVSKITYTFAAGQRDRFTILVPQNATITDIQGTNFHDYRQLSESVIDGKTFRIIEVRLQRPARKQYELSIRWLDSETGAGKITSPVNNQNQELQLIRAGDVSRESGTVTLYSAGGIETEVTQVLGGRRTTIENVPASLISYKATPVARYYWPYRPFSISVRFSRLETIMKVNLDQLVRVNTDRVELLVQANLAAEKGELFGASFSLPRNYELLSAVGPAVKNFYERSNETGNVVHIEFEKGVLQTTAALVLVRNGAPPSDFNVPTVSCILQSGLTGQEKSEQNGRLAVQVAASFDATTMSSENLTGVTPSALQNWLDAQQFGLVQFAYRYEKPNPSLRLKISSKPAKVRAEIFAVLVAKTTSANYTYRLRYTIEGSPIDKLSFSMPSRYASLVAVESPVLRSLNRTDANDGRTNWTISMLNEVTGIVDVAVNFALPIESSTKELSMPVIDTNSPEGWRTIVAVQNISRHEIKIQDSNNLTVLALSEQQSLMPAQMRESLQYVFQSFERDWKMSLALTQAKEAARIQAVVDLLAMTTVINRDGRCRYEVRVALQNRSEQFMKVQIPEGLNLWSASVASQPVKPVRDANSAKGSVLIPLVKTSPGGLPYDIVMYFADEGDKPLVNPFDGINKLKPPAISIIGMPVTRTTWSLRLPSGYKYISPGGNMSQVAGMVEMLILNNEARIEQLKRLDQSYRELAVQEKYKQVDTAKYNYDALNRKLASDIQQADDFLSSNRSGVSREEYDRLKANIEGQRQEQDVVVKGNSFFFEKQQEQNRNDMNLYLNSSASNGGIAEISRNEAMNFMPGFVGSNERQQYERLNKELQESNQKVFDNANKNKALEKSPVTVGKKAEGKAANDLIIDQSDKDGDMAEVLKDISQKTDASIVQRQQELQSQLSQMSDNRLQRYSQSQQKGMQMGNDGKAYTQQTQSAATEGTTGGTTASGRGVVFGGGFGGGMMGGGGAGMGGMSASRGGRGGGGMSANAPAGRPTITTQNRNLPGAAQSGEMSQTGVNGILDNFSTDGKQLAQQAEQPFTSQNVYSLPISLPVAGEIQLDFARSSGDAELSIWAVPVKTISKLITTLVIIGAFILVAGVIKLWKRFSAKRTLSKREIIVYLLLLVLLSILFGSTGLIISLLIVVLNEVRHMIFA